MRKKSAGILMYRFNGPVLQVLLAHPGGPFYRNKDAGVWSVPKGEFDEDESPLKAAIREFKEELGLEVSGNMIELSPVVQKSGKEVFTWALKGDFDPEKLLSNTFPLEWPPKSGVVRHFEEVDRVEWFDISVAINKVVAAQASILLELQQLVSRSKETF